MTHKNTKYLSALKGVFEGLVHDLKHPVNNLKHVIELLNDDYDNESRRKLFEKISKREIENITKLLNSLLSVAKPLELDFVHVDIKALINNIVESYKLKAKEKGINIITNFLKSDDFTTILLDPVSIERAFGNLINNAFYAMQCGGTLTISVKPGDEKKHKFLSVEFSDTGVGMTEDEINIAFNDFTKCKWIGLGIGLLECKMIISEHKGEILVKNKEGVGTVFFIKLPY